MISRHYTRFQLENYPENLTDADLRMLRNEKLSLLVFIVSICQIYLIRDVREVINILRLDALKPLIS